MSDSYTFKANNQGGTEYEISVRRDFLDKCPNPEKEKLWVLLIEYKMSRYFHNENGPAIVRLHDGYSEYWINGQKQVKESNESL